MTKKLELDKGEAAKVQEHYSYEVLTHFDKELNKAILEDAKATPDVNGGSFHKTGHLVGSLTIEQDWASPGAGRLVCPPDRLQRVTTRNKFVEMLMATWQRLGLAWKGRKG